MKAYAKIVVKPPCSGWSGWRIDLATDIDDPCLEYGFATRGQAKARARAWSRRLGNIQVEVQDD
jgi:hypothetical protein